MALTASQLAELEAVVDQFAAARDVLDDGATSAAKEVFANIEDWYAPAATVGAAMAVTQIGGAAQDAMRGLTAQFVSLLLNAMGDRRTASGLRLVGGSSRELQRFLPRGLVNPFDVHSRPVRAYRDAIATGSTAAEALLIALDRAERLILTDNALVHREAAARLMERRGVTEYRRVIHPELSRTGTCGLCIAASDRVYSRATLMPLHDRCKCTVMPIVGDNDPGVRLNEGDLGRIYEEAGSTAAANLKRTRYRIEQHGELGQVLVNADHASQNNLTRERAMARRAVDLLNRMAPVLELMRSEPSRYTSAQRDYQQTRMAQLRDIAA